MKYIEIAQWLHSNVEKLNRRVFKSEDDNIIFSIIKGKYNFSDNKDVSVLIDSDLGYMIDENILDDFDKNCRELRITFADVININISNKFLGYDNRITFNFPLLEEFGIKITYRGLYDEHIFLVKKEIL